MLSNHDVSRHRTRSGGGARGARAAALLLLTLPGTPFLYQGEELGLEDAVVPPAARRDPIGRDGCRAPMPWTAAPPHGWTGTTPWLPFPPDAEARSVERQRADPGSILHLYRTLLALRRRTPALHEGALTLLSAPADVLAYERRAGDDRVLVLLNFGAAPVATDAAGATPLAESTGGPPPDPARPFDGTLAPEQAIVLRPSGSRRDARATP